ncbi:MAG: TolC family protein [Alphaproteobacteria bacterium]|nr:TolC family protein [Alphaproteobacteria bacterium]MBV8548020.1 TolC family protein [Alphaproteobacteria bacterium]
MQVKAMPQGWVSVGKAFILAFLAFSLSPAHVYADATVTDQCADGNYDKQVQQNLATAAQQQMQAADTPFKLTPPTDLGQDQGIQGLLGGNGFDGLINKSDPLGIAAPVVQALVDQAVQSVLQHNPQIMSSLQQLSSIENKVFQALCTPLPNLSGGLTGLQQQITTGPPMCGGGPTFGSALGLTLQQQNIAPDLYSTLSNFFPISGQ